MARRHPAWTALGVAGAIDLDVGGFS